MIYVRSLCLRTVLAAGAVALLPPTASQAAGNEHSKLDRALAADVRSGHPSAQRVIVQTRSDARDALKRALLAHGDVIVAEHPSINALTVEVHGEDLSALDADPNVLVVSSDADVSVTSNAPALFADNGKRGGGVPLTRGGGPTSPDILRQTLGVDQASFNGAGIGVAILDSGIYPVRDLDTQIRGFWDFTRNGIPSLPYDDYGHGTHVAGLIASSGVESKGAYQGIAPRARLFGFKVLDRSGHGRTSDVIRALDFVVANRQFLGIDVINLSLGHPILESAATDPLVQAVERAVRAGVVVVVAVGNVGADKDGNQGYGGVTSPGNAPSAISVGASDTQATVNHGDDNVAWFSSRGPSWYDGFAKPDLLAPGMALVSDAAPKATLYKLYPTLLVGHDFAILSGTSMAAAVTTGVVADMLEANRAANVGKPFLTPNAVKAVLQYTALTLSDSSNVRYDALTQGAGELNGLGAETLASAIDTSMPVGQPWTSYAVTRSTTIAGETLPWSQNIVWGTFEITGANIVWTNSPLFAKNIVWGTYEICNPTDPSCDNIVWGTGITVDDVVWGDNVIWGTDVVWGSKVVGLRIDAKNIVWGMVAGVDNGDNIVWGTLAGADDGDNIVWGTNAVRAGRKGVDDGDNIVWGTLRSGKGSY